MKIAIHAEEGSYSDQWINYCNKNRISHKIVNCYHSDIIEQLHDCEGLMWHWNLNDYKAALFAKQLTNSLAIKGIKIFPNVNSAWHYDDKIGQKYLLEAIGAPLVTSHVFYTKNDAVRWIESTTFPKVFKLRGGAASINVRLVKTQQKAKQLVKVAFGKGFSHYNPTNRINDKIWELRRDRNITSLKNVFKGIARIFLPTEIEQFSPKQKGYVYFQDFIPNNAYDTRLVVIGERCFGARRFCRKGDFRASGSGLSDFNPDLIDKESVKIAFEVVSKLKSQSLAFDFVKDGNNSKIVEVSYCFPPEIAEQGCLGYWDHNLNWHNKAVTPQIFMIEDFLHTLR